MTMGKRQILRMHPQPVEEEEVELTGEEDTQYGSLHLSTDALRNRKPELCPGLTVCICRQEEDPVTIAEDSAPEEDELAGDGEDGGVGEDTEVEAPQRNPRRPKGKRRMRSRVTWDLCWAWYWALPEAQQTRIA
ncbi:hypothetical protein Taro_000087 [Colocasia esculenta]|uniref:Uncharacterized protein n=1 Tax=Colocasia esculenta TaxID=4460 RepID=A0A843TGN5_COLES|nr:hypothetical protein [Colocasia esculenta]